MEKANIMRTSLCRLHGMAGLNPVKYTCQNCVVIVFDCFISKPSPHVVPCVLRVLWIFDWLQSFPQYPEEEEEEEEEEEDDEEEDDEEDGSLIFFSLVYNGVTFSYEEHCCNSTGWNNTNFGCPDKSKKN